MPTANEGDRNMRQLFRSRITWAALWALTVVLVGVGAYFGGWNADAKFEDMNTKNAPPSPEAKLESQGRYDEAIRVILENKEGFPQASVDSQVAWAYLQRAKEDWANRREWAQQAAAYFEKAAALAPADPSIMEEAMDGFDRIGDYSDKGCPDYEKSVHFGEAATVLYQNGTVSTGGKVRHYPQQLVTYDVQPVLKRVRKKIDAWCK